MSAPDEPDGEKKKSASTVLVEMACARFDFGVSGDGETFAVPKDGPLVVVMLRGGKTSLRNTLAREYYRATGRAAPQQALADALLVVEGIAQDSGPAGMAGMAGMDCRPSPYDEPELHMRVASHGGALWLDLGDASGRCVRIVPGSWSGSTAFRWSSSTC